MQALSSNHGPVVPNRRVGTALLRKFTAFFARRHRRNGVAGLAAGAVLCTALSAQAAVTWEVQSDYFGERNAIAQPRTIRGLALSHDETSIYVGNIQSPNTGSTALRKVKAHVLATPGTDHVIFGNGMPGGTGTFGQVGGQPVYDGGGTGTFEAWRDVGNSPEGIDTDDRGYVYVAMSSGISPANIIGIYSSDLSTQVGQIALTAPTGVAVHKSGSDYFLFTMSGAGLQRWDVTTIFPATPDPAWTPAVFAGRSLAVDSDGTVFVAGDNMVRRVSADGTTVTHSVSVPNAADVAVFQDKIYVIKRQSPTQPIVVLNKDDLTSGGPDLVTPELGDFVRGSISQFTSIDVTAGGRLYVSEENYTSGSSGIPSYTPPATSFNPVPGPITGRIYFDRVLISSPLPDVEGPVVTCPPDQIVSNDPGACSALVAVGTATALDGVDGPVAVTALRGDAEPLGAPYPVGVTAILWEAMDSSGNPGQCVQFITVQDNEAPALTACPPDATIDATSPAGASFSFTAPTATDNCDPIVSVMCDKDPTGDDYPVGTTLVTCTATDSALNSASCSFNVTVELSGPRVTKQDELAYLQGLFPTITNSKQKGKVKEAINALTKSLSAVYWVDDSHLVEPGGYKVFDQEKTAVTKLRDAIKFGLSAALVQPTIDALVMVDRDLATIAIDEAIAAVGNAGLIAKAQAELAKGDAELAAGKLDRAIGKYKNAWKYAVAAY